MYSFFTMSHLYPVLASCIYVDFILSYSLAAYGRN